MHLDALRIKQPINKTETHRAGNLEQHKQKRDGAPPLSFDGEYYIENSPSTPGHPQDGIYYGQSLLNKHRQYMGGRAAAEWACRLAAAHSLDAHSFIGHGQRERTLSISATAMTMAMTMTISMATTNDNGRYREIEADSKTRDTPRRHFEENRICRRRRAAPSVRPHPTSHCIASSAQSHHLAFAPTPLGIVANGIDLVSVVIDG